MKDKRDECGCHRECTVLPHNCAKPCKWPLCLTPEEEAELRADIMNDPDLNPGADPATVDRTVRDMEAKEGQR